MGRADIRRRAALPRRVAAVLALLLLAACSTLPAPAGPPPGARDTLTAFALEGRFALRQNERNYSGRISWRHAGADNTLLLASPFGQGMAEIATTAGAATLKTSDGKSYAAADADTLMQQTLGYVLPLGLLVDWVRGRATDADVEARDALGRPTRLRHDDWRIACEYDGDDAQALPVRIVAQRLGEFELRLRVDAWSALSPDELQP